MSQKDDEFQIVDDSEPQEVSVSDDSIMCVETHLTLNETLFGDNEDEQ